MKYLLLLLGLVLFHTLPLWNSAENLAGGLGDPLAHAAIGNWYCNNIVTGNPVTQTYLAPFGVDLSGNYDSPFPFIATCAMSSFGSIFQFNLFTIFQIILIIFSSFLVAQFLLKDRVLQIVYVLFAWWTGYYVCKSHMHITLLSQIWGTQLVFFSILSLNVKSMKSVFFNAVLLGLSFTGTFQNIPGLFVLTLGLGIYKMLVIRKELTDLVSLRNIAFGLILALGIFLIAWFPMIKFHLNNEIFLKPDTFRYLLSLQWLDLIAPYKSNYLHGFFDQSYLDQESTNSLDLVVIISFLIFIFSKNFWRNSLNITLSIISLVYLFMAFGPQIKINDFLFHTFPFSLTRAPSRFAIEFYACVLLMTFISYDKISGVTFKKYLGYGLLIWIFLSGPILNQMIFFPTLSIASYIPTKGLAEFKSMKGDQLVANVPSAWAGDQSQNFLQLYHGKNITSGYLAYPTYTKSLYEKTTSNPFLTNLGCKQQPLEFIADKFMFDFESLKIYLKKNNITLFVFNKNLLFTEPSCKELADWSLIFLKQPWIKIVDENAVFVMAKFNE